jgi:hypothetical protein
MYLPRKSLLNASIILWKQCKYNEQCSYRIRQTSRRAVMLQSCASLIFERYCVQIQCTLTATSIEVFSSLFLYLNTKSTINIFKKAIRSKSLPAHYSQSCPKSYYPCSWNSLVLLPKIQAFTKVSNVGRNWVLRHIGAVRTFGQIFSSFWLEQTSNLNLWRHWSSYTAEPSDMRAKKVAMFTVVIRIPGAHHSQLHAAQS